MKTLTLITMLATVLAYGGTDWSALKKVEQSIYQYYNDCGFYPEKLDEVLEPTSLEFCHSGGGSPPAEPYGVTRETLKIFSYRPINYTQNNNAIGYQGYHLDLIEEAK